MASGSQIDYAKIINNVRQKASQRSFDKSHKVGLGLERFFGTSLSKQVKNARRLVEEGAVVWGAIVQANMLMFEPGSTNLPGNVIYSASKRMDAHPYKYLEWAGELFSLKGKNIKDPQLRKFACDLADERGRGGRLDIPPALTGQVQCYMNDIQFERKHLPDGYLSTAFYPLLIHRELPYVMVLPVWYWTKGCIIR